MRLSTKGHGMEEKADICVIGSGAGGAVAAKELSERGYKVILLEEGGYYTSKDFNQREDRMYPLLYKDRLAQLTKDGAIAVMQGRCVGGTTVINNAICFRPPEEVLDIWRRDFGVKGLSYDELVPVFEQVEKVINVYQHPLEDLNEHQRLLYEGSRAFGYRGAPFMRNVKDCVKCGCCMVGCSFDRKQSMILNYIPMALKYGTRLMPNAKADRILVKDGKAIGVECSMNGKKFRIDSKAVVLAAGAINSPQLLLKSKIANSSGEVGKNLYFHPLTPVVAVFDKELKGYYGITQSYGVNHFSKMPDGGFGYRIEGVFAMPGLAAMVLPSFGKVHWNIMSGYNYMAACFVLVHDEGTGQVTVGSDGRPVIEYSVSEKDKRKMIHGMKEAARIYLKAGARKVYTTHNEIVEIRGENDLDLIDKRGIEPNSLTLISAHPQGTCRMGEDPKKSVVNSRGESHDIRNLFICDASVHPTSVGVNPQVTIMAISTHISSFIKV